MEATFFHHDCVDFGGFGDEKTMRAAGSETLFEMELVEITEPVKHPKDMQFVKMSGIMKLVVWRKKGDVAEIREERRREAEVINRMMAESSF